MPNTWPTRAPEWSAEDYEEIIKATYKEPIKVTVKQIIENSEKFPIEFPIESVRCKTLLDEVPQKVLEDDINSVYPVIHEQVLYLYVKFLIHKRKFGSDVEKVLYQNMTVDGLVNRLLKKRAVSFVGPHDYHMLMDGELRTGGWEIIGTAREQEPLVLKDYLSYDEIKLSALLSVSSPTKFINDGNRYNRGVKEEDPSKIEGSGIIIGLIGPRLHKANVMEQQEMIIKSNSNIVKDTKNEGHDLLIKTTKALFLNFYGDQPDNDLSDLTKFSNLTEDAYFNNELYQKRLALSFDTLLIEANARARIANTMAFVHVVGIGLGVWKVSLVQNGLFMDAFAKRIQYLSSTLTHVADICFSYINHDTCGKYKNGDLFPIEGHKNNGIRIHILDRNPHEKLKGPSEGNLIVASYAWDGNAQPGNEFWVGHLTGSGDPAAASSTQISELHNPHINPRVSGANLRIATLQSLVTLEEYIQTLTNAHTNCKNQ